MRTPVSTALSGLTDALTELTSTLGAGSSNADLFNAELIDVVATLERHKRASAAVQASATAALSAAVKAADAERGTKKADHGCSVAPMIALARGESPYLGAKLVAMATALTGAMPHTLAALSAGRIDERTASGVAEATATLTGEDRARVDEGLLKEFTRHGVPGTTIVRSARALTTQVDPTGAEARTETARANRHVTLRPAPDAMTLLTALLPATDGAAIHTALTRAADQHQNSHADDDDRTRAQVTADVLTTRLTGQNPLTHAPRVVIHLVMTQDALLGRGDEPASVPGIGPIPAPVARRLIADADRAWVRRLFTTPDRSTLVAMDSKRRTFPQGLAEFIRARDQHCATPFCNARIQHTDHITPHARGGPTSAANGQGLCARCNYAKEQPGFTATRDQDTGVTTLRTPTGHEYARTPPPVLGHPTLPLKVESVLERVIIEVAEWNHAA